MKQPATRYTLTVWITVPHDRDDEPEYSGRDIEKRTIRLLDGKNKVGGVVDAELMETEQITEDVPERDEAYERAAARDRLDGFQRTNGKDWT